MYLSDPIDSDIRLVEDDGSSADYKEFDPFRYRFGLVDRGGTGRFLFGVRWYDPNQGVWTQQDSLDAPLDPANGNRYGYAGGDPVNNWDPTGYLRVEMGACIALCGSLGFNYDKNTDKTNLELPAGVAAGADGYLWIGDSTSEPGSWDLTFGYSGGWGGGVGAKGNAACSLIGNGCYAEGGIGGVLGLSFGPSIGVSIPIS